MALPSHLNGMARIGFGLLAAFETGASVCELADRLGLPERWVSERLEAARLCFVMSEPVR